MNMNTTISRRSLLAAAPVAAVAVAIPTTACASDLTGWATVKAKYRAADAAESEAIDRQSDAETALAAFWPTAPERWVTYREESWTSAGGFVVPASQRSVHLTRHDIAGSHLSAALRTAPEYLDYCREVQAWKNEPAHVAAQAEFDASDAATSEAMNVKIAAWHALIEFPLSDTASVAEKMAIAAPYVDGCSEWASKLIAAVQSDLGRVVE